MFSDFFDVFRLNLSTVAGAPCWISHCWRRDHLLGKKSWRFEALFVSREKTAEKLFLLFGKNFTRSCDNSESTSRREVNRYTEQNVRRTHQELDQHFPQAPPTGKPTRLWDIICSQAHYLLHKLKKLHALQIWSNASVRHWWNDEKHRILQELHSTN